MTSQPVAVTPAEPWVSDGCSGCCHRAQQEHLPRASKAQRTPQPSPTRGELGQGGLVASIGSLSD